MDRVETSTLIALKELREIQDQRVAREREVRRLEEERLERVAAEERRGRALALEERSALRRQLDDAGQRIAALERERAVELSAPVVALEPPPSLPSLAPPRRWGALWSLPALAGAIAVAVLALRPPVVRERVVVQTIPAAPLVVAAAPVAARPAPSQPPVAVAAKTKRTPTARPVKPPSAPLVIGDECDIDPMCHVDEQKLRR